MQLTELQMGLIALGVLGVGAVIGYNMWQERRRPNRTPAVPARTRW